MVTRLDVERQVALEQVLHAEWQLEQARARLANLDAALTLTVPAE